MLLELATPRDKAAIVERTGARLCEHVRRPLVRRAVDDAIRSRCDQYVGAGTANDQARRDDDADSASDRLRYTLDRMRRVQEEEIEPEAGVVLELCGPDLALGLHVAQAVLGPSAMLTIVLPALRGEGYDRSVLDELIAGGTPVTEGLPIARALKSYSWWPLSMRRSVLDFVREGGQVQDVLDCFNDLAFSRLTPLQQRAALNMLQSREAGYDLDGTAVAAAVLGITLPERVVQRRAAARAAARTGRTA